MADRRSTLDDPDAISNRLREIQRAEGRAAATSAASLQRTAPVFIPFDQVPGRTRGIVMYGNPGQPAYQVAIGHSKCAFCRWPGYCGCGLDRYKLVWFSAATP
jgi:hypothetical protein